MAGTEGRGFGEFKAPHLTIIGILVPAVLAIWNLSMSVQTDLAALNARVTAAEREIDAARQDAQALRNVIANQSGQLEDISRQLGEMSRDRQHGGTVPPDKKDG